MIHPNSPSIFEVCSANEENKEAKAGTDDKNNSEHEEVDQLPIFEEQQEPSDSQLNKNNDTENKLDIAYTEQQDLKCQGEGSTGSCGMVQVKKLKQKIMIPKNSLNQTTTRAEQS